MFLILQAGDSGGLKSKRIYRNSKSLLNDKAGKMTISGLTKLMGFAIHFLL